MTFSIPSHTIQKCKKMAGQNTFDFFLLIDAYMIGEHYKRRIKMPKMCPFEKRHFLTWIDLNSRFGRYWDTFLKNSTNGTFVTHQMKVFGLKKIQISCRESKVPNWQFLIWHFWFPLWNLKFFVPKYLHLKYYESAISRLFQKCVSISSKARI